MKIIKTQDGKIFYIFGAYFKDPIKDYIEFKQLFRNRRIYSREISEEFEIDLKRIFKISVALLLLIVIVSLFL